jgi:hypothetical protein
LKALVTTLDVVLKETLSQIAVTNALQITDEMETPVFVGQKVAQSAQGFLFDFGSRGNPPLLPVFVVDLRVPEATARNLDEPACATFAFCFRHIEPR